MKKKLTLLIALSTTLITIFGCVLCTLIQTTEASIASVTEEVSSEEADPVVPSGKEEALIEEQVESEIISELEPIVEKEPTIEEQKLEIQTVIDTSSIPTGEYPEATYVWNTLKAEGLSDAVCAGILGNIMAEIGGQTLDLSRWQQYSYTDRGYYGICQWAGGRKSRLLNQYGSSFEAQVKFLIVELYEIFPQGSAFYSMTSEKDAAYHFARYFERCSSKYYTIRQVNATKALNYFLNK